MFQTINSFNQIELTKPKSLDICDIDDTLLYWNKKKKDFYDLVKVNHNKVNCNNSNSLTYEEIEKEAIDLLLNYKCKFLPNMTDSKGFVDLSNKINSLPGSKIIFLTARKNDKATNNIITRKHFEVNGLVYDNYKIHYTDNMMSKGEYIKKYIDLSNYDEIFFIDDYKSYIKQFMIFFQI